MAQPVMLSDAVEEYMRLQAARRGMEGASTVAADNNVLRMFLRISGDKQCKNVTSDHLEKFFYGKGGIRDEHVSLSRRIKSKNGVGMLPAVAESTHNHYRSRLKAFVAWCVAKGYMRPGIVADAFDKHTGRIKPLKVQKEERDRPTADRLLHILDAADNPRDRIFIATILNTALRTSDVVRLTVGKVDLESGFITTKIQKTRGSDSKPISADLDREMRRWFTQYALDLGRPLEPGDYVFPRRRGGLISHYETDDEGNAVCVRQPYRWVPDRPVGETHLIVQKAMKKLGMETKKQGPHTLRHAVARIYFDMIKKEGVRDPLEATRVLLDHSNTATTQIYLGTSHETEARNKRLRGQPFLSALVSQENVVRGNFPRAEGE